MFSETGTVFLLFSFLIFCKIYIAGYPQSCLRKMILLTPITCLITENTSLNFSPQNFIYICFHTDIQTLPLLADLTLSLTVIQNQPLQDRRCEIPLLFSYKMGISPSRMTTNNNMSPMKFCYNTSFTLPKQSQRSKSIL